MRAGNANPQALPAGMEGLLHPRHDGESRNQQRRTLPPPLVPGRRSPARYASNRSHSAGLPRILGPWQCDGPCTALGTCLRLDRARSGFGLGLTSRPNVPVFDQQARDPGHVLKVAAHKGRSRSQCVGGYGHVKVLDPNPPALQVRLGFSELATDLICPRDPRKLIKEQSKAVEEALPPLRPWKPCEPVSDLGNDRLWQQDIGARTRQQLSADRGLSSHRMGKRVGV